VALVEPSFVAQKCSQRQHQVKRHADGATSTALSVLGMRALGCDNISYLVPNRFEDGYGLSPEVVDQARPQREA
ncbi:hypothetical protein GFJ91_22130, partial [Salmonella enterica subsp. enterica serovar Enteritidis]|nr:hypothetical protein [Salmonella enterica subsp. enterica serovar Enteritidis]